ncbi:hypothetical protein VKT23_006133 [Stygiomarasmius scandens]|uniref:Uncharacterized protein n=1 Tax=Marasmiellus scandens TaxID=2682957 RepID=A0ABR1JU12_9AGAR
MLVNSTWMVLHMRISSVDLHIPNLRYVWKIIHALKSSESRSTYHYLGLGCLGELLRRYCRSITFRRDSQNGPIDESVHVLMLFLSQKQTHALGNNVDKFPDVHLPALRRVSFELVDETLDRVFPPEFNLNTLKMNPTYTPILPSQMTTLEVFFYYSPNHTIWRDPEMREQILFDVESSGFPSSLPSVHTLRIFGGSAGALLRPAVKIQPGPVAVFYESDVSIEEAFDRLGRGMIMKLERLRKEREEERMREETLEKLLEDVEKEMRYLVSPKATDKEVLSALGLAGRDLGLTEMDEEINGTLVVLRRLLKEVLDYPRRDEVDSLAEVLAQKGRQAYTKTCRKVQT